jgi:hypothetical protein
MHPKLLYFVLLVFLASSCDTGGEEGGELTPDTPELKVLAPSLISETGFQLNWSITNPAGFNTIEILLSEDEEMTKIVKFIELNDISAQNVIFDGLQGATPYFYKITLKNQGSIVVESDMKGVVTSFKMESFSLLTEDSYSLSAKLAGEGSTGGH